MRKVICRPAIIVLMASSDFRTLSLWRCTKRARSLPSIRRMRPSGSRVNSVTGAEASARCSAEVERFLASLSSGSITMCPFICVVLSAVSQVLAQPRQDSCPILDRRCQARLADLAPSFSSTSTVAPSPCLGATTRGRWSASSAEIRCARSAAGRARVAGRRLARRLSAPLTDGRRWVSVVDGYGVVTLPRPCPRVGAGARRAPHTHARRDSLGRA